MQAFFVKKFAKSHHRHGQASHIIEKEMEAAGMDHEWLFWAGLLYLAYVLPGVVKHFRGERDLADDLTLIGTMALAVSLFCYGAARFWG